MLTRLSHAQLWQTITDAIGAGCPPPYKLYLARTGDYTAVGVSDPADVIAWAHYFGIPVIRVDIYPSEPSSTGWQRTVKAKRSDPWLEITHTVVDVHGPAFYDEYPLVLCPQCGKPMIAHLPSASIFPGEPFCFSRPYHCAGCDAWEHVDVTDPGEQHRVFAIANQGLYDLYPTEPTPERTPQP